MITVGLLLLTLSSVKAQNVICGKRTSKTVTVDGGESFLFRTQAGRAYSGPARCSVMYKLGSTCSTMRLYCSKSSLNNKDKRWCRRGDKITVTTGGRNRVYCGVKKPSVWAKGNMRVVFTADRTRHATGSVCKVTCTVSKPKPTTAPGSGCFCGLAKRSTKLPETSRMTNGSKIVGGQPTEVNEYPWQVGLVGKGNTFIFCGGSLISDRWVLTAAHCTYGETASSLQVILGEHDYKSTKESIIIRRNIQTIVAHSQYNHYTTNYDFALLMLAVRVRLRLSPHIRPVCLPLDDSKDYSSKQVIVTGWGTTASGGPVSNILREVEVRAMSNTECQAYNYPASWITNQMMCAAVNGGGKDACQGDSGGPMVYSAGDGVTAGQNYELVGVVSWGSGCAQALYPGVYSRVTSQLAWITATTSATWNTCPRT